MTSAPQKDTFKCEPPVPQNVTLLGNKVFVDIIQFIKMKLLERALIQYDRYP